MNMSSPIKQHTEYHLKHINGSFYDTRRVGRQARRNQRRPESVLKIISSNESWLAGEANPPNRRVVKHKGEQAIKCPRPVSV